MNTAEYHQLKGWATSRSYYYNVFGADEHIEVCLWKWNASKNKWHCVESHNYATGLTGIGKKLAEQKERDWAFRYGATRYSYLDD